MGIVLPTKFWFLSKNIWTLQYNWLLNYTSIIFCSLVSNQKTFFFYLSVKLQCIFILPMEQLLWRKEILCTYKLKEC